MTAASSSPGWERSRLTGAFYGSCSSRGWPGGPDHGATRPLEFGPGKACGGEGSTGPTPEGWLTLPGLCPAGESRSNYDRR